MSLQDRDYMSSRNAGKGARKKRDGVSLWARIRFFLWRMFRRGRNG